MEIDLPSVIVKQRIADQLNILDVRQKIEKRIARRRNQKFIARIAKRSKNVGICFARARGEENIFDRDFVFAFSVVTSNGAASGFQSLRIRFIRKRRWVAQRIQDGGAIVFESAFRGIRNRQIEQWL